MRSFLQVAQTFLLGALFIVIAGPTGSVFASAFDTDSDLLSLFGLDSEETATESDRLWTPTEMGECWDVNFYPEPEAMTELQTVVDAATSKTKEVVRKQRKPRNRKLVDELSTAELDRVKEINRVAAERHRARTKRKDKHQKERYTASEIKKIALEAELKKLQIETASMRQLVIQKYGASAQLSP